MSEPREHFQFTFVDAGDPEGVPVNHRLRALLKVGLRRLKLRCVACRVVPPGECGPAESATDDRTFSGRRTPPEM